MGALSTPTLSRRGLLLALHLQREPTWTLSDVHSLGIFIEDSVRRHSRSLSQSSHSGGQGCGA